MLAFIATDEDKASLSTRAHHRSHRHRVIVAMVFCGAIQKSSAHRQQPHLAHDAVDAMSGALTGPLIIFYGWERPDLSLESYG